MYSEEDLASAVTAGVLSEEVASAFRSHVARSERTLAVDEEHFSLLTGFNDVFVVIACLLLLGAIYVLGAGWARWLGSVTLAAVAWALAEFFTRKRRRVLPSIVLLVAFVGGVACMAEDMGSALTAGAAGALDAWMPAWMHWRPPTAGAAGALAAWMHWRRFKVPITVAVGAAAIVGALVVSLLISSGAWLWATPALFASGVAVFLLAMRWDAGDLRRQTRKSDVAFWLHLLAAPLLVHPIFAALGLLEGGTNLGQALGVVVLYVVLTLVSLAIDRRALMVSSLAYVLYAFSALLKEYGVVSLSFAITAFGIGSGLLLLSAFWHPSRSFVLGYLPRSIQGRLAPLQ